MPGMLKELAKHRIHLMPAVNTLFNGMANHPDFNTRRLEPSGGRDRRRHRGAEFGRQVVAGEDRAADPGGLRPERDLADGQRQPGQRAPSTAATIGMPLPNTWMKLLDDDGNEVAARRIRAKSRSRARRSWPATGNGPTKPPRS